MFFPFWDPTMILLIPALILAAYAQAKVQSTYSKYSQIRSASGRTGREVAQAILSANGIPDVTVEPGQGYLSDHYDPVKKTNQLSIFGVGLLDIGIFLFTFAVIFQLITLPVEFDASKRAIVQLNRLALVGPEEQVGAKKVLDATALTYVAAAAAAVLQLIRLLLIRDR